MDAISNVDRLVVLLRQRLMERAKAAPAARGAKQGETAERGRAALDALVAVEGVDDRQLKRALIQSVLADQFGSDRINDAQFQQVVERVTAALDGDPNGNKLLARVVQDLRAAARA